MSAQFEFHSSTKYLTYWTRTLLFLLLLLFFFVVIVIVIVIHLFDTRTCRETNLALKHSIIARAVWSISFCASPDELY